MRRIVLAVSLAVACTVGLAGCGVRTGNDSAASADEVDWRVLADVHGVGGDPAVHVATTNAEYNVVWPDLGFAADRPLVDLDEEVVVAFNVSYPSGCEFPFVSLDVDHTARTISPRYVGNEPAVCADDQNPYTVALAISRDALTADTYSVRLTIVNPDLADATARQLGLSD